MAMSVNKVTILGHLGRDPEVRTFQNGGRVVNLRIATSESWRDKTTGERKERTEWHSIAIFNEALGKIAENYLKSGSKVMIEGQLETRKWQDQDGKDRYTTEIVVRPYKGELILLDRANGNSSSEGYRSGGQSPRPDAYQRPEGQRMEGQRPENHRSGNGYGPNTRQGGTPYNGGGYGGTGYGGGGFRSDLDDDIPF